jgi:hypothetical protein
VIAYRESERNNIRSPQASWKRGEKDNIFHLFEKGEKAITNSLYFPIIKRRKLVKEGVAS